MIIYLKILYINSKMLRYYYFKLVYIKCKENWRINKKIKIKN